VSEFPFEDSEHGIGAVAAELPLGQHTFFAASDAAVFTPSTTVLTTLALTWPLCGGILASDFFSIALNNEVTEAQQTLLWSRVRNRGSMQTVLLEEWQKEQEVFKVTQKSFWWGKNLVGYISYI
jgi:hypothetical protein